jgi:hypothetical protein
MRRAPPATAPAIIGVLSLEDEDPPVEDSVVTLSPDVDDGSESAAVSRAAARE